MITIYVLATFEVHTHATNVLMMLGLIGQIFLLRGQCIIPKYWGGEIYTVSTCTYTYMYMYEVLYSNNGPHALVGGANKIPGWGRHTNSWGRGGGEGGRFTLFPLI